MKRKIDELGRVVIPKEMRKELDIEENEPVNIEIQDNKIIITKPNTVDYKAIVEKVIKHIEEKKGNLRYYEDERMWVSDLEDEYIEILDILNEKKD